MRQRQSVIVARDPDHVFGFLCDPRNLERWVPAVQEIEILDATQDGPLTVGDRFRQRVSTPTEDEEAWFEARVEELQPPSRLSFTTDGETGPIQTAFHLEPAAQGTRVTESLEVPLDGWATKVLAPFLWLSNRSRLRDQLADLKTTLEDAEPP